MIVRGFKSVIWVATVGGAALACYMVSLQVATERADLAKVERQIIAAKRDIRSLQTELGTRGRLSQLEQWNTEVLALSAPSSAQFLQNEVKLARFEKTDKSFEERSAEVRMAALSTGDEVPAVVTQPRIVRAVAPTAAPSLPVVRQASYTPGLAKPQPLGGAAPQARPVQAQPQARPAPAAAKPVVTAKAEIKPSRPADAKAPQKAGVKPVVKVADAKAPARSVPTKAAPTKSETRPAAKPPVLAKADARLPAKPAATEKPRASRLDGKLTAEIRSGAHKGQGSGGN
ncbi:hypothetical protein [Sphingosinicella sp. BN140058]|uniref:hypothetical protein n=1 Tax=Sphingosinicella sp. BN140058 TaxID=1892855 RepID=UPI001011ECC4|nr:hypothetical protein [Sphingosinicella sp. BN140058]QAY77758.1 hypothetical protein ETR14_15470 [Sphingosinicella sp. BN140058]